MATLEKILLMLVAVMYGVVLVFGGFNFLALLAAVVVSALIRLAFKEFWDAKKFDYMV